MLCALFLDGQQGKRGAKLPGLGRALACCPGLEGAQALAQLKKVRRRLPPLLLRVEATSTHTHRNNKRARAGGSPQAVQPLFVPEYGGSYERWRERPLTRALIEYAAADVAHLHTIRAAWGSLLDEGRMRETTSRRIAGAIEGESAAKGPHMADRDFA